jgi:hypothetical protein
MKSEESYEGGLVDSESKAASQSMSVKDEPSSLKSKKGFFKSIAIAARLAVAGNGTRKDSKIATR